MSWSRCSIPLVLILLTASAQAQDSASQQPGSSPSDREGWGVRVGAADDPDQFILGVQYDLGEVFDQVYFEPHLELGLGDDHTVLAGTAALHYRFNQVNEIRPYAGGGLVLGWVDRDRPGDDDSDFEIAFKAIGGVRWPLKNRKEFFLELNVGVGDLHDAEVLAGWRF